MRKSAGAISFLVLGIALFSVGLPCVGQDEIREPAGDRIENSETVKEKGHGQTTGIAEKGSEAGRSLKETPIRTAQTEPHEGGTGEETLRSLLGRKGWLEYLNEEVVDLLELDLDTPILFTREYFDSRKTFCNLVEVRAGKIVIEIDVACGRPRYVLCGNRPDVFGIPEDQLTTKEAALDRALELKDRLNVQGAEGEPVAMDIGGMEWKFRFERYYEGYRCDGRSFKIGVARNGGHIAHFYDRPPVYPASLVENIDRKAALEIAMPFLQEITGKPEEAIHIRDVEQVIALTTGVWRKDGPQPLEGGRSPTARLAWRIIYDTMKLDTFCVYIDSETGETLSPYFEM